MTIVIDTADSSPLFARLIDQIKKAIGSDELLPGDALPSVRQLANDLELDHEAVSRAYHLLELDAVIENKPHRGPLVHRNAKANSRRVGWSWCPLE